jgi:hypothetical protein
MPGIIIVSSHKQIILSQRAVYFIFLQNFVVLYSLFTNFILLVVEDIQ